MESAGDGPMNSSGVPSDLLMILTAVRESFRQVLLASGMDPKKTRETSRALNLDRNLVWRVTRIINAADILEISRDIPSQNQTKKFCQACEAKGAPPGMIQQLQDRCRQFESMVHEVFDDRSSFNAVAAGLDFGDVTTRQQTMREQAFLANSSIWGAQARVNFKTTIHAPSATDSDSITTARVEGLVRFRRLRPVPWPLRREHGYLDDGRIMDLVSRAVDPEVPDSDLPPIVPRFCSLPMPDIRTVKTEYGRLMQIPEGPLGNTGSLDIVFADVFKPDFNRYRNEDSDHLASMIDLITPAELLVLDMFLHRDLEHEGTPEAYLLDRLTNTRGFRPEAQRIPEQLPLSIETFSLGSGTAEVSSPRYPEYPDLLNHIFDCMDWRASEFRGYRLLMPYPPIPTAAMLMIKSPENPA